MRSSGMLAAQHRSAVARSTDRTGETLEQEAIRASQRVGRGGGRCVQSQPNMGGWSTVAESAYHAQFAEGDPVPARLLVRGPSASRAEAAGRRTAVRASVRPWRVPRDGVTLRRVIARWLLLVVALAVASADTAQADWRPARILARDMAPRAAVGTAGGGIALFAGSR